MLADKALDCVDRSQPAWGLEAVGPHLLQHLFYGQTSVTSHIKDLHIHRTSIYWYQQLHAQRAGHDARDARSTCGMLCRT